MKEIISVVIQPDIRMLNLLRPLLEALCREYDLGESRTNQMVLAIEEVFSYCVKILQKERYATRITVAIVEDLPLLKLFIEYIGPCGELEAHFRHGGRKSQIKCTTFEALGMHMAREILDDLRFYYSGQGKNVFQLSYRCKDEDAC